MLYREDAGKRSGVQNAKASVSSCVTLPSKGNLVCVDYSLHFFFLAWCSPAAESILSYSRLRGKQGGRGYISIRVCVSAEFRGGDL